jgi:signal transduction histidine kinase
MRLFLHQLHPVDLEREGLVGALHQRLAAVEGRSDIKARLLTDENLTLPLNVEVALYYIAQEALNNVLKHAHAKSVDILLRKRKTNYVLEIKDDGQGFITKKENLGCMGLNNMKERAMMAGGKLRIESHLGQGTKITVNIPKDRQKEALL